MLATYKQSLENLTTVTTVNQLLTYTSCPNSTTGYFWGGDYDDFSWALIDAGWHIDWREPYFFLATDRQGSQITYIEGDIYEGNHLND